MTGSVYGNKEPRHGRLGTVTDFPELFPMNFRHLGTGEEIQNTDTMTSMAMKQDWAQVTYFDEVFSLLAKENWNSFCKNRCCAQKGTGQWGTILNKTLPVPKNDGNGENPLYLICELGLLCPNAHDGRPAPP